MRRVQLLLSYICIVGTIVVLTGCAHSAAIQQLPSAEQMAFRAYRKVMTPRQVRTYLARTTANERTAYLETIGVAQRFQTLDPQDREAVLAGYIRKGMSAEAVGFLWGRPYNREGPRKRFEYWYYLGRAYDLLEHGTSYSLYESVVKIYFNQGRVVWWVEFAPNDPNGIGSGAGGVTVF